MEKEKIATNIVTYNRKDLLKECLNALLAQTRKPNSIIIVDNNSNDGTKEMLEKEFLENPIFDYVRLSENTGSAGGQYTGIKRAYKKGFDWVWIMDDDALPKLNALEELVLAKNFLTSNNESFSFLCSNVFWLDGLPSKMNIPPIDKKDFSRYQYLQKSLIKVKSASFVGAFFSRDIIKRVGLPIKEFFIWGDDVEYTARMARYSTGVLVGKSKIIHKTKENYAVDYKNFKKNEIWKYKYDMRNTVYICKNTNSPRLKTTYSLKIVSSLFKIFRYHSFLSFCQIFLWFLKGLFFNPKIEKID